MSRISLKFKVAHSSSQCILGSRTSKANRLHERFELIVTLSRQPPARKEARLKARPTDWSGRDWPVTGGAKVRRRHLLRNFVAGPRVPAPLMSLLNVAMEIGVAISIAMEIGVAISIAT